MELIQWANGKGYTLRADFRAEFELLKEKLDEGIRLPNITDVEVDEKELSNLEL